jgi:hypothetical protein
MVDLLDEIQEDIRRDRMKALWEKFGGLVILVAILIVVGTGGWRFYDYWTQSARDSSGDRFLQALTFAGEGDFEQARTELETLIADGEGNYPLLAKFRLANLYSGQEQNDKAAETFAELATDPDLPERLQDLAFLRAAYLQLDGGLEEATIKRLNTLAEGDSPFRHSAREILALQAYEQKNWDEAETRYQRLAFDLGTPQTLRVRARLALDVIGGYIAPDNVADNGNEPSGNDTLNDAGQNEAGPSTQ